MSDPSPIDQIAERVERPLARHEEVLRANAQLQDQVAALAHERDALLARFAEARVRLDAVLQRLPADPSHDGATTPAPPAPFPRRLRGRSMKQIEVQIMGQSYLLGCPEGGEARLRDAVERVDLTMCRIRDAGKVRARDRIAVLASLHLAYDLGQQTAAAEASAAEATAAAHLAAQAHAQLEAAAAARLKADIEAAAMARARAEADARLQAEAAARAQAEAEARRAALPPPPPPAAPQDRLDDLVKRLDQALAADPHLP